jgi:uncharacterized protein (TIGR03118 family)
MRRWMNQLRALVRGRRSQARARDCRPALEGLEDRCLLSADYVQTNLVSDIPGMASNTDPLLLNPWGLTASSGSPFWVSNNNSGTSTLYNGQGVPQPPGNNPPFKPLQVTIPTNTPGSLGSPTGTVFNTSFNPKVPSFTVTAGGKTGSSIFLFATEDGLIAGWSPGVDQTHAIVAVNNPAAGYKGLAIGTDAAGQTLLYAANFVQNTIDVYNSTFQKVTSLAGSFQDKKLPDGFAPFNIQNINNQLYVEYAKFDPTTTEGAPGHGAGFVDVFSTDGVLQNPNGKQHLISRGVLNAPWGVALAPANFGVFSNDLLVGNFGDGRINAFNPTTGKFLGTLTTSTGQPFQEDNLWALRFGNGAGSGPTNTLFFTAGINDQKDGLLGSLQAIPTLAANAPVVTNLSTLPEQTVTTIPRTNGDVNPYGVAFVPEGFEGNGVLNPGDVLVSNFNDSGNVQGTGTTIVRITPDGQQSVFFQGSPGLGLTTALGVLKSGFVIVGNVPTDANGTAQQGSLLILGANGKLVSQLSDPTLLNGPWDLTVNEQDDHAQVFVSNVLSGTVTRINLETSDDGTPTVESETQIASGYLTRTDPNALVVGPTGLAFDPRTDTLYVASTGDNAIFAIPNALDTNHDHGMGRLVYQDSAHLHGPLGLVLAPNGDLITANGDAVNQDPKQLNELVEFTPSGKFVGQFQLDPGGAGGAFGLAVANFDGVVRFAAVNDNTNALDIWTFKQRSLFSHDGDEPSLAPLPFGPGEGEDGEASIRAAAAANLGQQDGPDPTVLEALFASGHFRDF